MSASVANDSSHIAHINIVSAKKNIDNLNTFLLNLQNLLILFASAKHD